MLYRRMKCEHFTLHTGGAKHTHTQTHLHGHTHTHSLTQTHVHAHTDLRACTPTPIRTYPPTQAHTQHTAHHPPHSPPHSRCCLVPRGKNGWGFARSQLPWSVTVVVDASPAEVTSVVVNLAGGTVRRTQPPDETLTVDNGSPAIANRTHTHIHKTHTQIQMQDNGQCLKT